MPSRKIPVPSPAPRRSVRIMRRVTHGALLAVGLKAAQLAGETNAVPRLFDRGLLDRLHAPLTRYHE